MVVVGADVHKRTHTFVAVDEVGRELGQVMVAADSKGHGKAIRWARERFGSELTWGIEDCRHLSARLERDLLAAGQKVVRVPPKLMALVRASARTRGKSDPIDALAVARAVLREPDLPVASHDEVSRELKLLVDRRETLVGQRTATVNSLLWRVHELDPAGAPKPRSLDQRKHQELLRAWLSAQSGIVAELARDGKAWMLEDPRHSARNRARIEAMREAGKREIPAAATSIEEILAFDRDWAGQAVRRDDHTRRAVVRARAYALEAVPKGEFTTLLQLTRKLAGPGMPGAEENAAVEDFEVALKAAVERDARAVLALAAVTEGRAAWFVYSRDATATRAALAGIDGFDKVELGASRDPDWSEAMRALQALRGG